MAAAWCEVWLQPNSYCSYLRSQHFGAIIRCKPHKAHTPSCTPASLCTLCSHKFHTSPTLNRFMNKEYVLSRQLYQDMPKTGRVGIMFGQEKSGEQQCVGGMIIGSRSRSTAREQQPVGTVSRE